jgi:hypothetical protein
MALAGEGLEARLRQRLAFALDERLASLRAETGGLLDREALLLMLADEEGLLSAQATLEVEEYGADEVVEGEALRLTPTRTFRRSDGSTGFVADLDVRTALGVVRVVLWDGAVRAAQGCAGARVRLTALAARTKAGARELHSTRATRLERLT